MSDKKILVCLEQTGGKIAGVSFELVSEARKLADSLSAEVGAILMGQGVKDLAKEAFAYGADKVFVCDDAVMKDYRTESYTAVVEKIVAAEAPEFVFFPASVNGRDLSARVAARLGVGLAADCTAVALDGENIVATRPIYGGNLMTDVIFAKKPAIISVRPNSFSKADPDAGKSGEVVEVEAGMSEDALRTKIREILEKAGGEISLADANIIVSGGRGLGDAEGFKLIREFADTLGAAVGASRAAVDAGWIEYEHQVGQTGKMVSPKLYIACGISGALQHLAGMKTSDVIVAINKDEDAPIFSVANYGIVGDLYKVIPVMIEEFKKAFAAR